VAVEPDVRAVGASGRVPDPDHDASDDVARLDVAAGRGLLDAGDDHVAQPGRAPLVPRGAAAQDLEAHHFLGPGVVGHVEPGLHLNHENTWTSVGLWGACGPPGWVRLSGARSATGGRHTVPARVRPAPWRGPRPRRPGPAGRRGGR